MSLYMGEGPEAKAGVGGALCLSLVWSTEHGNERGGTGGQTCSKQRPHPAAPRRPRNPHDSAIPPFNPSAPRSYLKKKHTLQVGLQPAVALLGYVCTIIDSEKIHRRTRKRGVFLGHK
jgi:hypothetical protein